MFHPTPLRKPIDCGSLKELPSCHLVPSSSRPGILFPLSQLLSCQSRPFTPIRAPWVAALQRSPVGPLPLPFPWSVPFPFLFGGRWNTLLLTNSPSLLVIEFRPPSELSKFPHHILSFLPYPFWLTLCPSHIFYTDPRGILQ